MRLSKRGLAIGAWALWGLGALSWGQAPLPGAVFVTVPQLTAAPQALRGGLAQADFDLQGVVPIAHDLSFPTGLTCAPDGTLYVAEFSRFSPAAEGSPVRADVPEARVVAYRRDGRRQGVVARVPKVFIRSLTLGPAGAIYFSTGGWPEDRRVEFAGIWRVDPTQPTPQAVQVLAPEALPEVLAKFEAALNPRPPEVRQLTFVRGGPFAGDLLFAAGAGTLADFALYRAPVSGSTVGPPRKVALRGPWHNVASGPGGELFASDILNGFIAHLDPDLTGFEPFADLVEPFDLAVASASTLYVTTHEFDHLLPNGKKPATLWQLGPLERTPLGATGAWGVTVCP